MDELEANPWQGYSKGEVAEGLAQAMVGLDDDFDQLITRIMSAAGDASSGYSGFRSEVKPELEIIQTNGLNLAEDTQSGAAEIAKADYEAEDVYRGAWPDIPEVNFGN
ncbi:MULTISPECIES: hypothetical protein [Nocardiopsis]|nr:MULTISPECIES: hypothetical protein [Nocardiopsis]MEC3895373.1 hypothetical protein [Nocardiopsis sp. LDBS1602]